MCRVRDAHRKNSADVVSEQLFLVGWGANESDIFANLKELNQEWIKERLAQEIKCEEARDFLESCLQIDPQRRDNVYELLRKE